MAVSSDSDSSATPGPFDQLHAPLLHHYPELVRELGGDPETLLHTAQADSVSAATDRGEVCYRQFVNLLELAATELSCPDFGMRLAKKQNGVGSFGPLGLVMQGSATFGDALAYVMTHNYAHSLAARVWMERRADAQQVLMRHDILLDGLPNKAQAMEQILLLGHLAALHMTGGLARARAVRFRHLPVSGRRSYRRYFGCDVYFGCDEDGVVFSLQDLARPIIDPDRQAFEAMIDFIERQHTSRRPPAHAEVRGAILSLLPGGDASNERVARALNLHRRTLHRRLRAEGTSFQKVKDEVRRDILQYYLQRTDVDLTRISQKLGFSEQAVMSRCCQRWFDATPTQLRQGAHPPLPRAR